MARLNNTPSRENGNTNKTKNILTFVLGDEAYAIDILKVREIKGVQHAMEITKMVDVPAHVRGLIRLHDAIVPIIDLRIFYQLKPAQYNELNVIIVLNIAEQLIGVVVDTVLDIIEIKVEQIKSAPSFYAANYHGCIEGIVTINDKLLILLDIEKLIFNEALQLKKIVTTIEASTLST